MATVDDAHISVRFKHGIHTIFLYVDGLAPFADATAELLQVLRERYPRGLTTSIAPPKTTEIPDDARMAYGVLKMPNNVTRGWKKLKVGDGQITPNKLGLKNNSVVAFAVVGGDEGGQDEDAVFEVEWPREDEELYDSAR